MQERGQNWRICTWWVLPQYGFDSFWKHVNNAVAILLHAEFSLRSSCVHPQIRARKCPLQLMYGDVQATHWLRAAHMISAWPVLPCHLLTLFNCSISLLDVFPSWRQDSTSQVTWSDAVSSQMSRKKSRGPYRVSTSALNNLILNAKFYIYKKLAQRTLWIWCLDTYKCLDVERRIKCALTSRVLQAVLVNDNISDQTLSLGNARVEEGKHIGRIR